MSTPQDRLAELGFELPAVVPPLAAYVPAVRRGNLVWTAGQLPLVDGELVAAGLVGSDVTEEQAADCARICALNALAAVASVCDNLAAVRRVVKVVGYVASAPDFVAQSAVVDGASRFIGDVFGEAGRHARSAVGVARLPKNAPVEIELVAEVT